MDDDFPVDDPEWLIPYRIKPEERYYYGYACSECPERAEYATSEAVMCREHFTGGRCYVCGAPMTCFGRARGDYICEGFADGEEESVKFHSRVESVMKGMDGQ